MPQLYRRDPPNNGTEPSSDNLEPTDADDSIVLSDLVRTGEASRLRRRGAMRIDHTPRQQLTDPPSSSAPPQSSVVFVPNADTMWASYPEAPADEEYNPNSYPGEWIEMRDGQLDDTDYRQGLDGEARTYLISCGSVLDEEWDTHEKRY